MFVVVCVGLGFVFLFGVLFVVLCWVVLLVVLGFGVCGCFGVFWGVIFGECLSVVLPVGDLGFVVLVFLFG
ncbi:hypothetical protein, partial [Acinetobacter baumannii]